MIGDSPTAMENHMKRVLLALPAIFVLSFSCFAQSPEKSPATRPEDVKSIDSILTALYGVISGPAGERDWDRFRSLFLPQGRLTAAVKNTNGSTRVHAMSVEDYAKGAGSYFAQHAFFESPIVNRVQTFGNVSQVFSSYESRHAPGEAPFARGINSIQLLNDGSRWWVVSILWDQERSDNPLPKEFAAQSPAARNSSGMTNSSDLLDESGGATWGRIFAHHLRPRRSRRSSSRASWRSVRSHADRAVPGGKPSRRWRRSRLRRIQTSPHLGLAVILISRRGVLTGWGIPLE